MNAGSPEETRQAGRDLAKKLRLGDTVALFGDLGAGKTTFTQGIFEGLGIKENATSPSFVIINEYKIPVRAQYFAPLLYHIDLYRLDEITQIEDLGIGDLINDNAITVIEWAEKMGGLLPEGCVKIYFETVGENEREIKIFKK